MKDILRCDKVYSHYEGRRSYKEDEYTQYSCDGGKDCGFGQKMLFWRQAALLNELCNNRFEIQFRESIFPEHILFDFPHTTFVSDDKYEPNELDKLEYLEVPRLIKAFKNKTRLRLNKNKNVLMNSWILDQPAPTGVRIGHWGRYNEPTRMRLKYPEYENVFKKAFGKYYTIHLRRMNGIWFEDSDLEGMPASLQRLYKRDKSGGSPIGESPWKWHIGKELKDSGVFRYIKDEKYYNIMDNVLKDDPDAQFYICSDTPEKYYRYWSRDYNIVSRSQIIDQFKKALGLRYHNLTDYIVELSLDFFAMAYSKSIIAHGGSSFNIVASQFRGAPLINVRH
tara:strand:- start:936 stop:1946 length:1011 start_codon:yes stop_codon:yes gene_type:complete